MKKNQLRIFLRKWHIKLSLFAAFYLSIVLITGSFLLFRGQWGFMSPKVVKPNHGEVNLSIQQVIDSAQTVEKANIKSASDIGHIRAYPSKGYFLVRTKDNFQVQVDGKSGEVLGFGPRLTPLMIRIHEGKWFGSYPGPYVFLGLAFVSMFLVVSGAILYFR